MEQDEEQRISAPQTRESNGLFKSGTRKMTYEVNPDPGHAAVTSGTDPGLSKKKKKSPKRKTSVYFIRLLMAAARFYMLSSLRHIILI